MDHIITATAQDEVGMDNVRKIEGTGETGNTALIQKVMQGHFNEWNRIVKKTEKEAIWSKFQRATPEKMAQIETILEEETEEVIK